MTAPLVYIAAPLGAPTPALRRWHRERANLLAALAFASNRTPVCVHTYAELAIGDDTDPGAREWGLKRSMDALETVFRRDGRMWVLLRDDGTESAGTLAEVERWEELWKASGSSYPIRASTWKNWRDMVVGQAPHLLPEWDRLAERPPECIGSKGCAGEVVYTSPTGTDLCQVHLDIAQAESEVTP